MDSYTKTAIFVHWLMAAALAGMFALGLYMADLPLSPGKLRLFSWHKSAGIAILVFAGARLFWRGVHAPPPLPAHMSEGERFLARAGHGLLYLLMFLIPLSGWLMASADGVQTVVFGVLPLPNLLGKDSGLGELLETVHWGLNLALAVIVVGHAAFALKHHFFDRDDVLTRMLPGHAKTSMERRSRK
jgi:cytochrome b561